VEHGLRTVDEPCTGLGVGHITFDHLHIQARKRAAILAHEHAHFSTLGKQQPH
jgi:hypothetical protein